MKISIIGTGYVGLVTGTCLAHMGNNVTCMDVDEEKIANLKQGILPIYEPGLKELIGSNVQENRLHFTSNLQTAVDDVEFIFLAVGTPGDGDDKVDITTVLEVATQLGDLIDDYRIVIVKSTVPVGTSTKISEKIRERLAARNVTATVDVVSNPEFLKEGKAVGDFLNPDRIVIGVEHGHARERMEALYAPFVRSGEGSVMIMDIPSAELTKYAANAMLATRISFMNEIAALCEATGANVDQVRAGIGSDDRIGRRFLFAGVGYGGSCFPKDVKALARTASELGIDMKVLKAVDAVNVAQKEVMVDKVKAHYQSDDLSGKTFAVWGLSFKPETDDVRESPAAVIIASLLEAGAKIQAYDPVAIESFRQQFDLDIDYRDDMYDCLEGANAVLLVTEWHQFRRPEFDRMAERLKEPVIFDGRNQYEPQYADDRGFTYISIGRPPILNSTA